MRKMAAMELGWVVGLIEGEGCISVNPNQVQVILSMTDEDVVLRLQKFTGLGSIREWERIGCKKLWRWVVSSRQDCQDLLMALYPYLGRRRQTKALEGLAKIDELNDRSGARPRYKDASTEACGIPPDSKV